MSYDSRIDEAVRRLQHELGLPAKHVDGAWGGTSQEALIKSGKHVDYDWNTLRKHFGKFTQTQVDGFNTLIKAINKRGNEALNPLYAAYTLATTYHETAAKMEAINEYGKGAKRRYGKWYKNSKGVEYGHANHRGDVYLKSQYPFLYYGKGYPQLTWFDNYKKMGELLGLDLINNPDLALVPENSAAIMIEGMLLGSFTGLSLARCMRYGSYGEFIYSRRIINGTDRDSLVAGYAVKLLECLIIVDA